MDCGHKSTMQSQNCRTLPDNSERHLIGSFECCGDVYADELIDVRERFGGSYKTAVEDPVFKGSQCPWHYVIVGSRGTISPSGPGHFWVSNGKHGDAHDHNFPASEIKKYLKKIRAIRRA